MQNITDGDWRFSRSLFVPDTATLPTNNAVFVKLLYRWTYTTQVSGEAKNYLERAIALTQSWVSFDDLYQNAVDEVGATGNDGAVMLLYLLELTYQTKFYHYAKNPLPYSFNPLAQWRFVKARRFINRQACRDWIAHDFAPEYGPRLGNR